MATEINAKTSRLCGTLPSQEKKHPAGKIITRVAFLIVGYNPAKPEKLYCRKDSFSRGPKGLSSKGPKGRSHSKIAQMNQSLIDQSKSAGLKILVVEDYEDIRLAARLELEVRGYRVLEATNGEEAVELAWRECPDVILIDLSLPVVDGLTATRRIREDPQMKNVPIIAVTAHNETQYRQNALAAGCSAYVTKPVDFAWLDTLIGQLVS